MDLDKRPVISKVTRKFMFLSKTVNNVGMVKKLYESIFEEIKREI